MGHRSLRKSAPAKPSRGAVALFAVPGEPRLIGSGIDVPNKHIGTDLWLHQHYRICGRCATVDVQRNDDRAERDVSIARDCDIDAWASAKGRVGPRPRRGEP